MVSCRRFARIRRIAAFERNPDAARRLAGLVHRHGLRTARRNADLALDGARDTRGAQDGRRKKGTFIRICVETPRTAAIAACLNTLWCDKISCSKNHLDNNHLVSYALIAR